MNILVVNPNSGDARGASFWRNALDQAGVRIDSVEADNEASTDLTADDRLIVAGGDGTVRVQSARCRQASCALGVLPAGTGNDFARGLGIPLEPAEACRTIVDGEILAMDIGLVNDELFLNVAHIGLGSEISRHTGSGEKSSWGRFAYLRTLFDHVRRARGFRAEIEIGRETVKGRWLQITVANGTSFGGGQRFLDASPCDGQLDLLAIRPRPILQLFFVWVLARLRGSAPDNPAIFRQRATKFEVRGKAKMTVTADGEALTHLPARFDIDRGALRVAVPRECLPDQRPGID